MAIQDFFTWGAGGQKLTPGDLARRREIEDALLAKGPDFSPVGDWTQGLARVANAAAGAYRRNRLGKAEGENAEINKGLIANLLAGGSGATSPASSSAIPMSGAAGEIAATAPGSSVGATGPESYRNAIASIESAGSGDYSAVGPTNDKLGRALGRYQIMEANIGPWSQEALGRAVTPEEFLADPALQDAIFDAKFGQYVNQFGPEGAAQAWFAGPGGVGKTGRKDVLGTTVGDYGQKFVTALGASPATSPAAAAIDAVAPTGDPQLAADFSGSNQLSNAQGGIVPALVGGVPASTDQIARAQAAAQAPIEVAGGGDRVPMASASTGINPAIIEALTNPQASPQTQRLAAILLEQEQGRQSAAMEAQMREADPLRRLQIERAQLENDALRNPGTSVDGVTVGNRVIDRNTGRVIYEAPQADATFRQASPQEAQNYGAAAGQFGPDGRFYPINPPQGTALQVGPNGEITFNQGAGVKPLTEAQSKDTLYATRATNALPLLNQYEDNLMSLPEAAAGAIPFNLGNYAQSEDYQIARDAGRDFLATILRKDTGAAITAQEEDIYGKMFLPQPGDKPATIQAKRQRRSLAVEAIKAGMPPTAIENMAKALGSVPASTDVVPTDIPGVTIRRKN